MNQKNIIRMLRGQAMDLLRCADTLEQEADVLEASGRAPREPRSRQPNFDAPVSRRPRRASQPPSKDKLTALANARNSLAKARSTVRKQRVQRNAQQYNPAIPPRARRQRRGNGVTEPAAAPAQN